MRNVRPASFRCLMRLAIQCLDWSFPASCFANKWLIPHPAAKWSGNASAYIHVAMLGSFVRMNVIARTLQRFISSITILPRLQGYQWGTRAQLKPAAKHVWTALMCNSAIPSKPVNLVVEINHRCFLPGKEWWNCELRFWYKEALSGESFFCRSDIITWTLYDE